MQGGWVDLKAIIDNYLYLESETNFWNNWNLRIIIRRVKKCVCVFHLLMKQNLCAQNHTANSQPVIYTTYFTVFVIAFVAINGDYTIKFVRQLRLQLLFVQK